MEYKYNGIKIDSDFDLEFVKEYHYQQTNILRLLNEGDINQDQFQQLQSQYFENSYLEARDRMNLTTPYRTPDKSQ